MREAYISQHGDRTSGAFTIRKSGMNRYTVPLPAEPAFVWVTLLTAHRVSVVHYYEDICDIHTFNLRDGFHPGSDMCVRVYTLDDPALLGFAKVQDGIVQLQNGCTVDVQRPKIKVQFDTAPQGDTQIVAQPLTKQFRMPVVTGQQSLSVETLITRTPPTPIETNIEIAMVRHLGPLRSR